MIPKKARYEYCIKKSIEFILTENTTSFPHDPNRIIKKYNWSQIKYSTLAYKHNVTIRDICATYESDDGYSIYTGSKYSIAYNDNAPEGRIYFTKFHEIGHIYLNHFIDFDETILARSKLKEKDYKILEH
ncbi:MAG: ImmA/IrrE family metallo-endopeptidase, partial [Filifactoraceae bacterium]